MFGSNLAGRHGKGSALEARMKHGAVYGVGQGRTGNAYAIPTKDEILKILPLSVIGYHVQKFKAYAEQHPDLQFDVVAIG
ncbi:A1S_2505 family phage non-structural protein, partial [Parvimonas micra]